MKVSSPVLRGREALQGPPATRLTDRIIEKLEMGTVPWHKPWRSIGAPRNLASKKFYRGVNIWLLTAQGYTSPYWATIRQINQLGGQVRKAEKSTPAVFWKIYVDGIEVTAGEPEPEGQGGERARHAPPCAALLCNLQHGAMRTSGHDH